MDLQEQSCESCLFDDNDICVLDKREVIRWSMRRITLRLLELVEGLRWYPSTTCMLDTGSLDRNSRL